jgi:hypothetical protein
VRCTCWCRPPAGTPTAAAHSPSGSRSDGDSTGGARGGGSGGLDQAADADDVTRAKDKNRVAQKKFRQRQKVCTWAISFVPHLGRPSRSCLNVHRLADLAGPQLPPHCLDSEL